MFSSKRKVSSSVFGAILVCFLLPFVTVSCSGETVAQLSGLDLLIGSSHETVGAFGTRDVTAIPADSRVILAFVVAVVGLVASLLMRKRMSFVASGAGVIGALLLLWFKSGSEQDVIREAGGLNYVQLDFNLGYWGSFWLFVAAAFYQLFPWFRLTKPTEPEPSLADTTGPDSA